MKKFLLLLGVLLVLGYSTGCGDVQRVADDARETAHQQFDPSALLKKYMWFKMTAASLDAQKANVLSMENDVKAFKEDHKGESINSWSRDEARDYRQKQTEANDTKLAYNNLASTYNAAMAEFNYGFCNAGKMPQGMPDTDANGQPITPLPKSFATYMVN